MIKSLLKKVGRSHRSIEMVSYLIQNNILNGVANFSGDADFAMDPQTVFNRFSEIADEYISAYPHDLKDKVVLELGPGRSLTSAYCIAKKTRCRKVYAYDAYRQVWEKLDKLIVQEHFRDIHNVVYLTDRKSLLAIDDQIDYVISNVVLEHVWNLDEVMSLVARICREKALMYHVIDFRNHNKFVKDGELYFLKFSDTFWRWMASNVGHPNRKLISDYERLFDKYGFTFEPVSVEYFDEATVRNALDTYLKGKYRDADFAALLVKGVKVLSRKKA